MTAVVTVALALVAFGRLMAQTPSSKETPSCESGLEWGSIDRLRCLASRAPSSKSASCVARAPNEWKTYVDKVHGFCLSYPSVYERRNQPWVMNYSGKADYSDYRRKAVKEGRVLILGRSGVKDAYIFIQLDDKRFDLERFIEDAPTGVESPPEPIQVGSERFYYYGAGGGGVDYPDQYFFNLKGKTLYIIFDGPYAHEKGPSYETKQMEIQMLSSFRKF